MKAVSSFILVLAALLLACEPSGRAAVAAETESSQAEEHVHPIHHLPARCFAYVGDAGDTRTWKLPYLNSDGGVDTRRLPAAIAAVIAGYRGKKVSGIPGDQLPAILVRLGRAAAHIGNMPYQNDRTATIYWRLEEALDSLNRLGEITIYERRE